MVKLNQGLPLYGVTLRGFKLIKKVFYIQRRAFLRRCFFFLFKYFIIILFCTKAQTAKQSGIRREPRRALRLRPCQVLPQEPGCRTGRLSEAFLWQPLCECLCVICGSDWQSRRAGGEQRAYTAKTTQLLTLPSVGAPAGDRGATVCSGWSCGAAQRLRGGKERSFDDRIPSHFPVLIVAQTCSESDKAETSLMSTVKVVKNVTNWVKSGDDSAITLPEERRRFSWWQTLPVLNWFGLNRV